MVRGSLSFRTCREREGREHVLPGVAGLAATPTSKDIGMSSTEPSDQADYCERTYSDMSLPAGPSP